MDPEALAIEHLDWALEFAARLNPIPRLRDEVESEARLTLWQSALAFDPSRGASFRTFAGFRITGAVKDVLRASGLLGFRRARKGWSKGDAAPRMVSEFTLRSDFDGPSGDVGNLAMVASDDHPVGWEIESQEEVEALVKLLPARGGEVIRLLYLDCRAPTMKRAGELTGISESRVSQVHALAATVFAEHFANRREIA